MKRKIFISLNLPERTKKSLVKAVQEWQDLPVKWVKEENLHVTLSFLGHVSDDVVAQICEKASESSKDSKMIDLEFKKIELGPSRENPKIIWLIGEASEELRLLRENIEKALGIYVASKKSFRPHVTIGRIRQHKWQALGEIPEIEKNFPLVFTAESVDIMASEFEEDGREYTIIQSCPLK